MPSTPVILDGTSQRTRLALALFGGAVTLALITTSQLYLNWTSHGYEPDVVKLAAAKFVEWGLWAVFVPGIVGIERRYGFRVRPFAAALLAHVAAAGLFFAVLNGVLAGLTIVVDAASTEGFWRTYVQRAEAKAATAVLIYAVVLAGSSMLRLREERHIEAAASARLRADLADARLRNLRTQMHPHFLFNTLHTVASLVREGDRATALETLEELSDLLRRAMRTAEQQEVPLREEIEFVRRYVNVQRLRFGERLRFDLEMHEGTSDALVPSLVLQPLVENAIRHGLDLEHGTGLVRVVAQRVDGSVIITVEDNGAGLPPGGVQEGLGLGTTRRRLEHLYKGAGSLMVVRGECRGTRVVVRVPYRQLAATPTRAESVHD